MKEDDSGSDSAQKSVKPEAETYDYAEWVQLITQVWEFTLFTKWVPLYAVALASYTGVNKIVKNTVGFTCKDIWID